MKTVCDLVDVVCPAVFASLDFRNRKVLRYAVAFVCLCHSFQLLEQFYCFYETFVCKLRHCRTPRCHSLYFPTSGCRNMPDVRSSEKGDGVKKCKLICTLYQNNNFLKKIKIK